MEELKYLVKLLNGVPNSAMIIVGLYFFYKLVIIGSSEV